LSKKKEKVRQMIFEFSEKEGEVERMRNEL